MNSKIFIHIILTLTSVLSTVFVLYVTLKTPKDPNFEPVGSKKTLGSKKKLGSTDSVFNPKAVTLRRKKKTNPSNLGSQRLGFNFLTPSTSSVTHNQLYSSADLDDIPGVPTAPGVSSRGCGS